VKVVCDCHSSRCQATSSSTHIR